jgi:hypothetical protein
MNLQLGLAPPMGSDPAREGIWSRTICFSLVAWLLIRLRRGGRGKQNPGMQGQASWLSCVINLVNTSEYLLSDLFDLKLVLIESV